jgi:predicted PurR-regulated permease PerM
VDGRLAKPLKLTALGALALLLSILLWRQLFLALKMAVGGGVIAFILEPLCVRIERRFSRAAASGLSLAIAFLIVAGALTLLIPPLIGEIGDLAERAPELMRSANAMVETINRWLEARSMPSLPAPSLNTAALSDAVGRALGGTISMAGSIAGGFAITIMTIALGYYFLADRDRMLLYLELAIPQSARRIVLRMASGAKATIRLYLRAQVTISLIVGSIAGVGFWLIGLNNPILLGAIVAVFNLIPYFGPFLGGIPVTVSALAQGFLRTALTLFILFAVQQMDGLVLSPRIMGGVMGVHPAAVLLAIAIGSSVGGIMGMLFALPILLIVKTCLRVWAARRE